MMLYTKYQSSRPCGFREDFFTFCLKQVTPGGGQFWPQGDNLNKYDRGQLGDAKYQISKL